MVSCAWPCSVARACEGGQCGQAEGITCSEIMSPQSAMYVPLIHVGMTGQWPTMR